MGNYIGRTYGFANCGVCGNQFEKRSGNSKYCSRECSMKAHGETGIKMNPRPCQQCGTTITHPTAPAQKYCESCIKDRKRQQNREKAKEYRRAQGAKAIGETIKCADCGKPIVRNSGWHSYCQDCISKHNIARFKRYAIKHPDKARAWQRKATDSLEFSGNRTKALKRDNYTCQVCTAPNVKLHVHHIDGKGSTTDKAHRNNDIDNLITLCDSCHMTVHNIHRWHGVSLREALRHEQEQHLTRSALF